MISISWGFEGSGSYESFGALGYKLRGRGGKIGGDVSEEGWEQGGG